MPGTTRYSATFDRPYEEEDRIDPPPPASNTRRSRSQSWQANSGLDGRPYTPLGGRPPFQQRSSSTDNGPPKGPEHIPTRTARTAVKAHNNPFQFVKVGTCPLYKKAEEQLKKAKEVKKPDVLKEEEEEWQSNLDSWKSRRRKMSEDVIRRQEEIKQLELEEQIAQVSQKKTKTFSEMVESRATRGRALSLCLISSPLEFQDWEFENKTHKNGSISYTDESEENSTVNSEDEGVSIRGRLGNASQKDNENNHRTNGDAHIEQNGSKLETQNGDYKKLSNLSSDSVQIKPKENSYIDSGLESISSSHRAGDTPDSGSDFSPDSNSSIDCDSPRTGVNILEEFTSKTSQISQDHKITVKLTVKEKGQDFGFTILGGKDEGQVYISSVLEGSKAESSGIHLGDQIIAIDGNDLSSKRHIEIIAMMQKAREKGEISLLLSRHNKTSESTNGFKADEKHSVKPNKSDSENAKSYEKSIESENEMYVDDFEELRRQSELLASSNKSEKKCTNNQEQTNGNKSSSNKDVISLKTSLENSSAPKLKDTISNGAVEEPNKNEQKTNSELNSENQKKNVVKVKRVRRKGVYALNVTPDPNQISQGRISANSLFPLSPVTELPSPAEETKTIASTLSSNNTTEASNSQNEVTSKEKSKEAEVKISSPTVNVKENIKTPTTALKTTSVSSNELKVSSEKIVNKTESVCVPSSPTKNKDKVIPLENIQNEKPKSVSAPKKVKVKVKKVTASENTSATSPNVKDATINPISDVSAKTVTKENLKESNNSQVDNMQRKVTNGVQNVVSSEIKENGAISSGTTAITPATEALTSQNKISTTTSNIGNLSPKIITKNEKANSSSSVAVSSKQPKITTVTSEEDKSKPHTIVPKKIKMKPKGNATEQTPDSSQEVKETSIAPVPNTSDSSTKNLPKENQPKKEQKSIPFILDKQVKMGTKIENAVSSQTRENGVTSTGIATVIPNTKSTTAKEKNPNTSTSDKTRNLTLKIDVKNEPTKVSSTSPISNKPPKTPPRTPQGEKSKPVFAQKKENAKPKEKDNLSLATTAVTAIDKTESQKSPTTTTTPPCNIVNNISSVTSDKKTESLNVSSDVSTVKNDVTKSSVNVQDEKPKPPTGKKSKNRSKKKNTNSQKVNIPAKQNEELKNSNDSLNIVFQSQPKNMCSENQSNCVKNSDSNSNKATASADLVPDVPPVEKVAEEMEKLILEQLEEEERAKELSSGIKNAVGSPEHLLTAPPRLAEPPKEKPPPPPSTNEGNQKDSSLKRVNSTKRIKKEIHKRRSNFLGIDNADENVGCNEPSIPPPPALEEILKAEMELDRQSRLKIENASTERLTLEEKEIMQKEKEIIETLESEERQRQLINGTEDFKNVTSSNLNDVVSEQDRIESLKNERKRIETERLLTEEQQQVHLLEEKQLREREEFIRKQEASKQAVPLSDSPLSVANNSKPALSSLSTETHTNVSLSGANGGGKSLTSNSSTKVSEIKSSESDEKNKSPQKPAVPPKPLKKKEAIRKERERLRQEQEALQREREEHRRKLMLEQEELLKHQKSHAPDAPVSRLGPLPPLVQPNFPPQLTSTMNANPNARESASFPSRSHHGAPNGVAGSMNTVELMGPPVVRQNTRPTPRKTAQNESWGQQKVPSVRKQNHDSLTESRYNQNHWLIQEAEMRRIAELKERQRATQLPCSQTHLAEDDVCSNPPRVPVIPPTHNPQLNYAVQDKMWNYGQSNMPIKKYPPPVVKEPLHTIYPRETVSQQPPTKPSRVMLMERQEQMLSVSGRKRCSHCNEELGRGAAMIIESLQLYYHIHCFQCCVCQAQLGNGSCGTDVRVRNNKLHCHNCYSNDEAGLKFSQV